MFQPQRHCFATARGMMRGIVFAGRPVIGIAGGIGSGKSFVARVFGQLGCYVIDSDRLVADAYRGPAVVERLRNWWGDEAVAADGSVDRPFIASKVFNNIAERQRLEQLIHPIVNEARRGLMVQAASDAKVKGFVWDTPLLFESGLNLQCDAVVFVEAPVELRIQRIGSRHGWDEQELRRRENSQWPLDRKRDLADYVIRNTAEAGDARNPVSTQVRTVFSRILAKAKQTT